MTEIDYLAREPIAQSAAENADSRAAPNHVLLLFIIWSLLVTMSIGQNDEVAAGSVRYWLLITPAIVLPMVNAQEVLTTLFGTGRALLLCLLIAGTWHIFHGDARAVIQLGLLVLVLSWISSSSAVLRLGDLVWLYTGLVIIGCAVYLTVPDLNSWGLVPKATSEDFGVWRISFF